MLQCFKYKLWSCIYSFLNSAFLTAKLSAESWPLQYLLILTVRLHTFSAASLSAPVHADPSWPQYERSTHSIRFPWAPLMVSFHDMHQWRISIRLKWMPLPLCNIYDFSNADAWISSPMNNEINILLSLKIFLPSVFMMLHIEDVWRRLWDVNGDVSEAEEMLNSYLSMHVIFVNACCCVIVSVCVGWCLSMWLCFSAAYS